MTEPIEARLLRLAEAATPGPTTYKENGQDEFWWNPWAIRTGIYVSRDCESDAAFIAALSPSTVSRLARVVAKTREYLTEYHWVEGHVADVNCEWLPCAAVASLDAEQEGAE